MRHVSCMLIKRGLSSIKRDLSSIKRHVSCMRMCCWFYYRVLHPDMTDMLCYRCCCCWWWWWWWCCCCCCDYDQIAFHIAHSTRSTVVVHVGVGLYLMILLSMMLLMILYVYAKEPYQVSKELQEYS